jgi:hypothetical protein
MTRVPTRAAPPPVTADDEFWLGANGARFPAFGAALLRALAQHAQNTGDGGEGEDDEEEDEDEEEELIDEVSLEKFKAFVAQPSPASASLRGIAASLPKKEQALLSKSGWL